MNESTLHVFREVHLFKIPPLTATKGYKASDWKVEDIIWKGRCRIISINEQCFIKFEEQDGTLFAECLYSLQGNTVEPVTDSSRFFVIKIQNNSTGQHAFIGLGFIDRNESFDFNVALQDFAKQLGRCKEDKSVRQTPKVDLSLKEGATIKVNIGGMVSKNKNKGDSVKNEGSSAPFFLPPPPK
jgi:hypothetical protein